MVKTNGDSINFVYDAMQQRVLKKYIPNSGDPVFTYYITDASGNPMSIYERTVSGSNYIYTQKEIPIYGSRRIGEYKPDLVIYTQPTGGASSCFCTTTATTITISLDENLGYYDRKINSKEYELDDHLGNVRVTVSDRKNYTDNTASIISYNSYYSFGMLMPNKNYISAAAYRYGFNGQEKVDEIVGSGNSYDYGMRMYDPRLCRFMSTDPVGTAFPWWTPYAFAGNTPIWCFDLDGLEPVTRNVKFHGLNMKIHLDKSRPQEFTISWGLLSWNYNFYTSIPKSSDNAALYNAAESMDLINNGHTEGVLKTHDAFILRRMAFLGFDAKSIVLAMLEQNPDVTLVVVGNHMVGQSFYHGYDEHHNAIKFEPLNPDREIDFTRARAQTVKEEFFNNSNYVKAISVWETSNRMFPNSNFVPPGSDANGTAILFDTHNAKTDSPNHSHVNPRIMGMGGSNGAGRGNAEEYEKGNADVEKKE